MKRPKSPVTVTCNGVAIKTFQQTGDFHHVTIPIPALLKILASDVPVRCIGEYTDDYSYDADRRFGIGSRTSAEVAQMVRERRHFRAYMFWHVSHPAEPEHISLHWCNDSYEIDAPVTITPR